MFVLYPIFYYCCFEPQTLLLAEVGTGQGRGGTSSLRRLTLTGLAAPTTLGCWAWVGRCDPSLESARHMSVEGCTSAAATQLQPAFQT